METVYETSAGLEAHVVSGMLNSAGIHTRIDGEYLAGAAGELPLGNLVRVRVAAEDAAEARRIIAEWEKRQPPERPAPPARQGSWAPLIFILGGGCGYLLAYALDGHTQVAKSTECVCAGAQASLVEQQELE
jgi:hypothetical protein